jgi:C-terminal processing protease CtpA/Prc
VLAAFIASTLLSTATFAADDAKANKDERARAELQQKLEAAQKRLDAAAREVADLSMTLSDDVMPHIRRLHTLRPPRAVLGIVIGSGSSSRREEGVEVLSVSPGGGAAEAGLKAGDVLTEFNGKPLKASKDEPPETQFLEAMRGVDPGEKVTLKYLRDGKPASATVEARNAPGRMFNFGVPAVGAIRGAPFANLAFIRADGVFGSAQLVSLTPKLGQYFGSEKGLLVVRAPSDARLKLEEGDVVVDIDGRVPSSPSHALQILSSYQSGEKMKLNVLRMKKRLTFDITIPEDAEWGHAEAGEPGDVFLQAPPGPMTAPMPPPGMRDEIRIIGPEPLPNTL